MITHFKRLLGQIFYYGLGDIITKLSTVIILPIFSRFLSPADFGVASILTFSTVLVSGLSDLGLSISTYRYYFDKKTKNRRQIISTAQIFVTLVSTLVAIIALLFSHSFSKLLFETDIYSYVLVLAFLSNPLNDWTVSQINRLKLENKAKTCTIIRVFKVITDVMLKIIFVVLLKRGLSGLFEAQLINAAIYAFLFFVLTVRTTGFGFSLKMLKSMLVFGLPFAFSPIFFGVLNWADRFILGRLTNLTEVGLYTLGYMVGMAVMLPVGAFSTAWPIFYLSIAKDAKAKRFFSLALTYFSFVIGYFIILIVVLARDYFYYLMPVEFHSAYLIVPIIAFSYAFLGHYSIMITGTYLKRKTIYIFATEIIAVAINIILMFLLIPRFGRFGAAWATFISYLSLPILIYGFTNKIFPIRYEYKRLLQIVIAVILVLYINQIIYQPGWLNLLWRLVLSLTYPLLLYVLGFFGNNERNLIAEMLKKIKLRRKNSYYEINRQN